MRMSESTKTALAASVAVGYLLGRSRKAKLAMTVATYLASRRLQAKPQELLAAGAGKLGESPQLAQLVEQLRGEVLNVGRDALKALADRQLSGFADALADRTESLTHVLDAAAEKAKEGEEGEEGEDEAEPAQSSEGEGEEEEGGEEERGEEGAERDGRRTAENRARPRRPRRDSDASSSAPAKKTGKKAPPRKTTGKPARKAPAESSPRR